MNSQFFQKKREKNKKNIENCFAYKKKVTTFAVSKQNDNIGSLDEWLSQRSAKPCTAVRIC